MFENYIYPPRPEKKFPEKDLTTFEKMGVFIAQPKLNGSCCVAIVNDEKLNFYNRHKETFAKFIFPASELRNAFEAKGLTIFCGEYLNKSQDDETKDDTNGRLVLFDILWYDGKSLVGTKFADRQILLRSLFKIEPYNDWVDKISNKLYIVKNFESDFKKLWDDLVKHEVYEGLVLKKKHGLLQPSERSEKNNMDWQIKCRKPTKNYTF